MIAAVILAGHRAGRRSGLEWVAPRLTWPIAGSPLIHWQLRWVQRAGVERVALCCSEQAGIIGRQVAQLADLAADVDYMIDQVPRGPAGCARDAAEIVAADTYVVLEGGLLPEVDLEALLAAHGAHEATATVVTTGLGGDVPHALCAPVGLFVFERDALEQVPPTGYQDIKETLLPRLYATGATLARFPAPRPPLRVHTLDSYLAAQGWALQAASHDGDLFSDYEIAGDVWVHATADVAATARLVGPLLVGPHGLVSGGAIVIGPGAIGARSAIGAGSVLGRCVLWEDCRVGRGAHLEDCVLTAGTRVADGQTGARQVLRGRTRWHLESAEAHEWAV